MIKPNMLRIDCHVHTYPRSGCSTIAPDEAVAAAIAGKIDIMVLTEHDYIWPQNEIDALRSKHDGSQIRIFAGLEATCRNGHFLVFGLSDRKDIYIDMPAETLIDIAHERDAAVVVAHPFRFSIEDGHYCYRLDVDGVEVMSSNTSASNQKLAEQLANDKNLMKFMASDAHTTSPIGHYFTEVPPHVKTVNDLARFIRGTKPHNTTSDRDLRA